MSTESEAQVHQPEVDLSALLRWVCNIQWQPFAAVNPEEPAESTSAQAQAQSGAQQFLTGLLGSTLTEDWRVRAAQALLHAGALAFADDELQGSSPKWTAVHFAAELGDVRLVQTLVQDGGLWNAVDAQGLTPGDVAYSLNHADVYRYLLDEGVRQTMLLTLLERRKANGATSISDEEEAMEQDDGKSEQGAAGVTRQTNEAGEEHVMLTPAGQDELTNNTEQFLQSKLRFLRGASGEVEKCLDQDGNMVMASWETDIMRASAAMLAQPHSPDDPEDDGWTVLNIGFGLGIVDRLLQSHKPKQHVIIEPHPDALSMMQETGWVATQNGQRAQGSVQGTLASNRDGAVIVPSTWQDAVNQGPLSEDAFAQAWAHLDFEGDDTPPPPVPVLGPVDAIYFDTYSEDYATLRSFFERVPSLLASGPQARFGFFHGLAATNAFLYDVMTAVVELDLRELGFKVEWHSMAPGVKAEDWEGVRREYWTLDEYRLANVSWDE